MNEFILIWLLICPVCGHKEEIVSHDTSYYRTIQNTKDDYASMRNIVECPKCGVAVFAKLKKYTEVIIDYIPTGDNLTMTQTKKEVIRYDVNYK